MTNKFLITLIISIMVLYFGNEAECESTLPPKSNIGLERNAAAMEEYLASWQNLPLIKHSDWINVKTDITPAAVGD